MALKKSRLCSVIDLKNCVLSKTVYSVFVLLLLLLGGCNSIWLSAHKIDLDDYEAIRRKLEPDVPLLFNEAREMFAQGKTVYAVEQYLAFEKYDAVRLIVVQYEDDDGTMYEVLFAFASVPRGFGDGLYYTPSGKLPLWAPMYGVVCSKHVDGFWYAFRTVDSDNPPSPRNCPEDLQYRSELKRTVEPQ
jgi:hypothetical protein